MTEREKLEELYLEYNYSCFVCGARATQRAHIIGNTKANRKKYGPEVIDNPLNWLPACSLTCNALVDIGKNEVFQHAIATVIKSEDYGYFEKRRIIEQFIKDNIERKRSKRNG